MATMGSPQSWDPGFHMPPGCVGLQSPSYDSAGYSCALQRTHSNGTPFVPHGAWPDNQHWSAWPQYWSPGSEFIPQEFIPQSAPLVSTEIPVEDAVVPAAEVGAEKLRFANQFAAQLSGCQDLRDGLKELRLGYEKVQKCIAHDAIASLAVHVNCMDFEEHNKDLVAVNLRSKLPDSVMHDVDKMLYTDSSAGQFLSLDIDKATLLNQFVAHERLSNKKIVMMYVYIDNQMNKAALEELVRDHGLDNLNDWMKYKMLKEIRGYVIAITSLSQAGLEIPPRVAPQFDLLSISQCSQTTLQSDPNTPVSQSSGLASSRSNQTQPLASQSLPSQSLTQLEIHREKYYIRLLEAAAQNGSKPCQCNPDFPTATRHDFILSKTNSDRHKKIDDDIAFGVHGGNAVAHADVDLHRQQGDDSHVVEDKISYLCKYCGWDPIRNPITPVGAQSTLSHPQSLDQSS